MILTIRTVKAYSNRIGLNTPSRTDRIGYNRDETVTSLVYNTAIDDAGIQSLHLLNDSTDYQNTSGKTAYAVITVNSQTGVTPKKFKIYSAPTINSKSGATLVFDSTTLMQGTTSMNANGEKLTTWLLPIQNNHFIVLENTTGTSSQFINVILSTATDDIFALVIEQAQ